MADTEGTEGTWEPPSSPPPATSDDELSLPAPRGPTPPKPEATVTVETFRIFANQVTQTLTSLTDRIAALQEREDNPVTIQSSGTLAPEPLPRTERLERLEIVKPKYKEPSTYYGKNIREHTAFITNCEKYFKIIRFEEDDRRVDLARGYLEMKPQEQWDNYAATLTVQPTWKMFVEKTRAIVQDPTARRIQVGEKYRHAKQGARESIEDFLARMVAYEKELPAYTEEQLKDNLFHGLRPENQKQIMLADANHPGSDRKHMVALIARYESIPGVIDRAAQKDRAEEDPTAIETPQERKARKKAKKASKRRADGSPAPSGDRNAFKKNKSDKDKEPQCFNCGKRGHRAPECHGQKSEQGEKARAAWEQAKKIRDASKAPRRDGGGISK